MEKCSYPGCNYLAEVITNHHCTSCHGLLLKEVKQAYGPIQKESPLLNKRIQSWINEECPNLSAYSFHELTCKRF